MRKIVKLFACCIFFANCSGSPTTSEQDTPDPNDGNPATVEPDDTSTSGEIVTPSNGTSFDEDTDTDGDGVPDVLEGRVYDAKENVERALDSDRDGIANYLDDDADNNGILDKNELDPTGDIDDDGRINVIDLDDDGDNISDAIEVGDDPASPWDTDGDGTPNLHDTDSDGDTIADKHEGNIDSDLVDTDGDGKIDTGDGIPNYLDPDSDGDGIDDVNEAGDADISTEPRDTDADFIPDFLDVDSDSDGLLDGHEIDNNTSPYVVDTDDDGASDMVEFAADTDPNNPDVNPDSEGHFVFFMPYDSDADPQASCDSRSFAFSTDIVRADIAISMDTTLSMIGEIQNLKDTLISTIIPDINTAIPDTGMAVCSYDDFPMEGYGHAGLGDEAFHLHRSITTLVVDYTDPVSNNINPNSGRKRLLDAVTELEANGGGDGPESGWEMLYQIATGAGFSNNLVNSGSPLYIQPFSVFTDSDIETKVLENEEHGTIGGVGFREDALPIVIWNTDACSHNSVDKNGVLLHEYEPAELVGAMSGNLAATQTDAIEAIKAINANVISVISSNGHCGELAIETAREVAYATGALVTPEAWDNNRPDNCSVNQCCTGYNESGEDPDDLGQCPLVFNIDGNGNGVGTTIVTAVKALVDYSNIDVSAHLSDDTVDSTDALAAFINEVGAYNAGDYASDHDEDAIAAATTIASNAGCSTDLAVDKSTDSDGNPTTYGGANNRFPTVSPGSTVCFNLEAKCNTTIEPKINQTQLFEATINVRGNGGSTILDKKNIYFLVPPRIEQPFIPPIEEIEDNVIVTPGADAPQPLVIPQTNIVYR